MPEKNNITRTAGVVGAATFLSRILGFIRDVVIAGFFGAGLWSDAFFVAFRIPNLLRRLFAEGSLSIAFIPIFTERFKNKGKDDAFEMARSAIRLLSILLVMAAIVGILLAPVIVGVVAPGFISDPGKLSLTITLTRIMFPYVFFICLVALCMGVLNALGHFAAPALAPVFLNIAMIGSVFLVSYFSSDKTDRIIGLAIGVLIGGVLQLSLQVPFLIKKGFYFWQKAKLFHPGLKRIGALMGPAVFSAAVYQINILVGTLLASLLPEGSVSYLYYADRLVQFPLGIFAISTATAILPTLSRDAAEKDFEALKETFAYAIKLIFFVTIPAMTGLIVLREPIIALLFQRGAFDEEATRLTSCALFYYSIGLWAFSAVRVLVSTFFALQDTKTPLRIASASIIVNIAIGAVLMLPFGHGGLALATSIASMLNFGLLIQALGKKLDQFDWENIMRSVCKSMGCSAIMGAAVWGISFYVIPEEGKTISTLFWGLIGSITAGCLIYGVSSFLVKSKELEGVMAVVRMNGRGT